MVCLAEVTGEINILSKLEVRAKKTQQCVSGPNGLGMQAGHCLVHIHKAGTAHHTHL